MSYRLGIDVGGTFTDFLCLGGGSPLVHKTSSTTPDPSLAFDTLGNVFYSYIVVYVGNGNGINGTAMAVARSGDGGRSYPQFTVSSLLCDPKPGSGPASR